MADLNGLTVSDLFHRFLFGLKGVMKRRQTIQSYQMTKVTKFVIPGIA
jgi:hypothetical protein